MAMNGPLSGFRDFLPAAMSVRNEMVTKIKSVYEKFGFLPLETPGVERYETLMGKYGEDEKLIYNFEDKGGRKIALRYDLTVPLARVVGQYLNDIALPFRRYQVGNVWRGESPQTGRYREFMQFDADVVGAKGELVEAEIIAMMVESMKALGIEAVVRINNRKILDSLAKKLKLDVEKTAKMMNLIDKAEKVETEVMRQWLMEEFGEEVAIQIASFMEITGSTQQRVQKVEELLGGEDEGLASLKLVFEYLRKMSVNSSEFVFDQTIARGLSYYTGIVYETKVVAMPELGSVCSGGRYDNLIKQLGGPDLPAVGTSIGVDRLLVAMEKVGGQRINNKRILVTNWGGKAMETAIQLVAKLRSNGEYCELYPETVKIEKQMKYADKNRFDEVYLVGEVELNLGKVLIKNMVTGEQKLVDL